MWVMEDEEAKEELIKLIWKDAYPEIADWIDKYYLEEKSNIEVGICSQNSVSINFSGLGNEVSTISYKQMRIREGLYGMVDLPYTAGVMRLRNRCYGSN